MKPILITPGEPAGIGPDIVLQIAQHPWPFEWIAIADPALMLERAKQLNLPIQLSEIDPDCPSAASPTGHQAGTLKIMPTQLSTPVVAGELNPDNALYVLNSLSMAASYCVKNKARALVTGPVNKNILNRAGISFSGHTEYFADYCQVKQTVMLFVAGNLKVALATTHLPLADVPKALTKNKLRSVISVLQQGLKKQFHIADPFILVCGLNPHAGEGGYLGLEEIDVITPLINELRAEGQQVSGPFSADTIFTAAERQNATVLAMYHDQALPLIKYISFGHAVNVTLGLPFIRTSVDHGTALDMAGTGKADAGSLHAALRLADKLSFHDHSTSFAKK